MTEGFSNQEIIDALAHVNIPSSERSLRRAFTRWGVNKGDLPRAEKAGISWNGEDNVEITGAPKLVSAELTTPEALMNQRGLDPEEWEVASASMSEWDSASGERMNSLKCYIKRIRPVEFIQPARIDGPVYKPKPAKKRQEESLKVVFVGDQQAPYFNEILHEKFCNFLYDWWPHKGILIGDTIDFPDISRHPDTPEKDVTPQECIDCGYDILRNYREAHEPMEWTKLAGNHDERLRRYQIDKAPRIFSLSRAKRVDEPRELPALDVGHLMRLDELGINYVRPDGDYEFEQVKISEYLAAVHGWIARKGSGASALATLEQLGYSVVHGHTHRQSIVHKTRHDIDGYATTLVACETGCMCNIDGLGYTKAPDWQNGFATAEVFPDGTFHIDLATFIDGALYHRDTRY